VGDRIDLAVGDFGRTLPRLRRDLIVSPRAAGSEVFYLLQDPTNSRFFRLGVAEYRFISLLDGRTPVQQALSLAAKTDPEHAVSEAESIQICKWLLEAGLLEAELLEHAAPSAARASGAKSKKPGAWNPLFARIPLGVPDPIFARLAPWMNWLFSPIAYGAWAIVLAVAAAAMLQNWPRAICESSVLLSRDNWLWLGCSWLVLKLAHEAAHGVACKLRGGYVRETGLIFILFVPAAYVDVTSAWSFHSKWRRIETAAAGMYVETWLAACAAILWCFTGPGLVSHLLLNVMALASVATLAVNANPLMRFDGYYILSDLLEIPNLYQRGQQHTLQFLRRMFFGGPSPLEAGPATQRWFVAWYGAASLVWRVVFSIGLVIAAALFFEGAGIVLAIIALASWTIRPGLRFLKLLVGADPGERRSRLRFWLVGGLPGVALLLAAIICPWPGACTAPAVVEFAPLAIVRAEVAGFIERLHVEDGQAVEQGDVLVVLRNDPLQAEAADLRLALQQSQIQSRIHEQKGAMAACQAERSKGAAIATRLREKEAQLALLEVRAPMRGAVMAGDLATNLGSFVRVGHELLSIGSETSKEIRIAVAHDQYSEFAEHLRRTAVVRLPGGQQLDCPLAKIEPRAIRTPPHAALSAKAGGPLAVRMRAEPALPGADSAEGAEAGKQPQANREELVEPRFVAVLELTPEQSSAVRAGQVGSAWIRPYKRSALSHVWTCAEAYLTPRTAN
jgi:putative peptide zinc metalloprotease protein